MNGSRNKPAPTVSKGQTDTDAGSETNRRDRKTGGGMLKKLKSRRSQTDKWPVVTEDELRALGKDITPDHVLGLRAVTEGKLREANLVIIRIAPLHGHHLFKCSLWLKRRVFSSLIYNKKYSGTDCV